MDRLAHTDDTKPIRWGGAWLARSAARVVSAWIHADPRLAYALPLGRALGVHRYGQAPQAGRWRDWIGLGKDEARRWYRHTIGDTKLGRSYQDWPIVESLLAAARVCERMVRSHERREARARARTMSDVKRAQQARAARHRREHRPTYTLDRLSERNRMVDRNCGESGNIGNIATIGELAPKRAILATTRVRAPLPIRARGARWHIDTDPSIDGARMGERAMPSIECAAICEDRDTREVMDTSREYGIAYVRHYLEVVVERMVGAVEYSRDRNLANIQPEIGIKRARADEASDAGLRVYSPRRARPLAIGLGDDRHRSSSIAMASDYLRQWKRRFGQLWQFRCFLAAFPTGKAATSGARSKRRVMVRGSIGSHNPIDRGFRH